MTTFRPLGSTSPIGLGCSRFGSILGANERQSANLIAAALDHGINFFDTSDIYGQGDSERILGRVLRNRQDVVICTKIGKVISPTRRLLLPLKQIIRGVTNRSSAAQKTVRGARARPMPANWSPQYLATAIDRSLSRLKRDRIDILMLHGADAEIIRRGAALDMLERAKAMGKVGLVGLSVDTDDVASIALMDDRVTVLQVPMWPGSTDFNQILTRAAARDVPVVAREIFGGVAARTKLGASERARALAAAVSNPGVAVSLIGTTKTEHLIEAVKSLPRMDADAG
jgi:aryl-alcohol dehydrogenase-like predicted oxidoreductase